MTYNKSPDSIGFMKKGFTKEYLIEKLKEASAILGTTPSQREMAKLKGFPSRGAYRYHFGTFEKAKKIAGLPPSPRGMHDHRIYEAVNKKTFDESVKKDNPRKSLLRKGLLSTRFRVLHRDNFHCWYCGRGPEDGVKLHVDHVNPKSNGGVDSIDNLVTACVDCNQGKYDFILSKIPK